MSQLSGSTSVESCISSNSRSSSSSSEGANFDSADSDEECIKTPENSTKIRTHDDDDSRHSDFDDSNDDSSNDDGVMTFLLSNDKCNNEYRYKSNAKASDETTISEQTFTDIKTHLGGMKISNFSVEQYMQVVIVNINRQRIEHEERIENRLKFKATHISRGTRLIVVDWMSDVRQKFKLSHETFVDSMYLFDACLSSKEFVEQKRSRVQLLGCSCLMISAKMNETYCPEVRDYVYIVDEAYRGEEFVAMEKRILMALNFSLLSASHLLLAKALLQIMQHELSFTDDIFTSFTHFILYVCDVMCIDESVFNQFEPLDLALAALWIAHRTYFSIPEPTLTPTIYLITQREAADVEKIAATVSRCYTDMLVRNPKKWRGIRRYYSAKRLSFVAKRAWQC